MLQMNEIVEKRVSSILIPLVARRIAKQKDSLIFYFDLCSTSSYSTLIFVTACSHTSKNQTQTYCFKNFLLNFNAKITKSR